MKNGPSFLLVLFLTGALLLSGCALSPVPDSSPSPSGVITLTSSSTSPGAPTPNPTPTLPLPPPLPPPAPAAVAQNLQEVLEENLKIAGSPGIVAQVVTPEWSWSGAAGIAGRNPEAPADVGMRFRIASVTKTLVAAAVLTLLQDGKLALDQPAANWLPSRWVEKMPNRDQVTLRHLLQHTSGLSTYPVYDWFLQTHSSSSTLVIPPERAVLEALNGTASAPGSKWEYNNAGFLLLSYVLEKASGLPYDLYLQRTLFQPLGMDDTLVPTGPIIDGPHMRCLAGVVDYTDGDMGWARGAGDLISTVEDLNAFHRALRAGSVLKPEVLAEMFRFLDTPEGQMRFIKPGGSAGYGLGYERQAKTSLGITLEGHSGGVLGSLTFLYYWVEKDTYFCYNVNTSDPGGQFIVLRLAEAIRPLLSP